MSDAEQIHDLQARLAFQEDAIDQLSETVAKQDIEIQKLERMIKILNANLKALDTGGLLSPSDEAPPPHY